MEMTKMESMLVIFGILFCSGILPSTKSTGTEEAAADDDDEIALEDYVDNELPNFSGDVSSTVLGESTGYDVHIEVKIANRTKTKKQSFKNNQNGENVATTGEIASEQNESLSPSSPMNIAVNTVVNKNRVEAKKILDLIIEKLKHKKDVKEKVDERTDVEIENKHKRIKHAPRKKPRQQSLHKDLLLNENIGEATDMPKENSHDLIEENKENKRKGASLPLKDQETTLKSKDDSSYQKSADSSKDKELSNNKKVGEDVSTQFTFKESRKKGFTAQKGPHKFNFPQNNSDRDKSEFKGETFSFKKLKPQQMPVASMLTDSPGIEEPSLSPSEPAKSPSSKSKKDNKYIKIKVSGDEIRIKVPEFLNKTALFSKIVGLIEDDGGGKKKKELNTHSKYSGGNNNYQKPKHHEPKLLANSSSPLDYKYLLLKKVSHKADSATAAAKPVSANEKETVSDQGLSSDAIESLIGGPAPSPAPKGPSVIHRGEDPEKPAEPGPTKLHLNPLKEKNADDAENDAAEKKTDHVQSHEEPLDHKQPSVQGGFLEGKEDISGRPASRKDGGKSERTHAGAEKSTDENEFNERIESGNHNEGFMPNDVASKSFQENLEPIEMTSTKPIVTVDTTTKQVTTNKKHNSYKNVLNIVPDELNVNNVDESNTEKENAHASKSGDSKPSVIEGHRKIASSINTETVEAKSHAEQEHNMDEQAILMNPGRLFNDSLFQQAGMEPQEPESSSPVIAAPPPSSSSSSSSSTEEKPAHHASKSAHEKKTEQTKINNAIAPIIDVLTFPEIAPEKSLFTTVDLGLKSPTFKNQNENLHKGSKHKSQINEKTHEKAKHIKTHTKEKHEKSHASEDSSHTKTAPEVTTTTATTEKKQQERAELALSKETLANDTGKFKPLNNPLPSILFKEIMHTDDGVAKIAKKSSKNDKKKPKTVTEDDTKSLKKMSENNDISQKATSALPSTSKKTSSVSPNTKGSSAKLDLSDLESLQLQSKDDIELGTDDNADDGTGDDEYEDASGDDDDDVNEIKAGGPDQANLSIANLAIWKASEDIHALLHSLTDKEHADKVLGNLRNFIRNKHSVDAKKRDLFDAIIQNNKKGNHVPGMSSKSIVKSAPPVTDIKRTDVANLPPATFEYMMKKSRIPKKLRQSRIPKQKRKRRVIEFARYTNRTGQGIDRLYNQLTTANARIPPTFSDDSDGWSSDEVTNVMDQLKSTEIEDDLPTITGTPEYQEGGGGGAASYTAIKHHIGLPQNINRAASETNPMKELFGYQREIQNALLQRKLVHAKIELFSKSPILNSPNLNLPNLNLPIPEFRKSRVQQQQRRQQQQQQQQKRRPVNKFAPSTHNKNVNLIGNYNGNQAASLLSNATAQVGNGDFIEGTSGYNLNKDTIWNPSFKRDSIKRKNKT